MSDSHRQEQFFWLTTTDTPILTQTHNSLHLGYRSLLRFLPPLIICHQVTGHTPQEHNQCVTCSQTAPQGALKTLPSFPTFQARGQVPSQD